MFPRNHSHLARQPAGFRKLPRPAKRIRLQKEHPLSSMRTWSIPAGKLFGVELRIDVCFMLLLLFVAFRDQMGHVGVNPWRGTALVGIIFGSVVLHEVGHILTGRQLGISPRAIVLLPV